MLQVVLDPYYLHRYTRSMFGSLGADPNTQDSSTAGLASGLAHRKLDRILGRVHRYVPRGSLLSGKHNKIFIDHLEFTTEAGHFLSLSY